MNVNILLSYKYFHIKKFKRFIKTVSITFTLNLAICCLHGYAENYKLQKYAILLSSCN